MVRWPGPIVMSVVYHGVVAVVKLDLENCAVFFGGIMEHSKDFRYLLSCAGMTNFGVFKHHFLVAS